MEQVFRGSFSSSHRIVLLGLKLSKKNGLVKKYGFLVPINGVPALRQLRQYSALRNLRPMRAPLLRLQPSYAPHERGVAMFVFRAMRSVLKLRYLVLGGAVSGGMTLQKTYDDWMESLKEFSWIKQYLPDREHYDQVREKFLSVRENVKLDPRIKDFYELKVRNIKEKLSDRWEKALKAAEDANKESPGFGQLLGNILPDLGSSVKMSALAYGSQTKKERYDDERFQNLQNEMINEQLKHQKDMERLERENKELKRQLLLRGKTVTTKKVKKSLIDMYSEVLDELSDYDMAYCAQDHLPRVVVVGDQSAGKTSVLEMIVEARIFPRGAGEMMTRAPVMVTLSEGPYHVAQFKDSAREFDLTQESELADLRREVELRMKNSVAGGKTISDSVISMTVKGPGLRRIVLVDLPGVISSETVGMADNTKDEITRLTKVYMSNPNAIILCIQDGSVDAERSNVTELVSQVDPQGKRTIFVLTKMDMAEQNLADPTKIKKILSGSLFRMNALGYFAVVTGRGKKDDSIQTIRDYEDQFFRSSKFIKQGVISSAQVTTRNLSNAVADCFWKMVRETVEQQADTFKATRFNLETEWKNNFPKMRLLDRDELFEKARGEILDEVASLSQLSAKHWDDLLFEKLWEVTSTHLFENIYLPACQQTTPSSYMTFVDIALNRWVDQNLPYKSIECAKEAFKQQFHSLLMQNENVPKDSDKLFDQLKTAVVDEVMRQHTWEEKGADMVRALQKNSLEYEISDKHEWDTALKFMEGKINQRLQAISDAYRQMFGPGAKERWLYWRSQSPDQLKRSNVKTELDQILLVNPQHESTLTPEELTVIRKNLQAREIDVDSEYIRNTWYHIYRRHFLLQAQGRMYNCRKMYYLHRQGHAPECSDVVLSWRFHNVLKVTASALRQQIISREARRLEREVKEVLEDYSQDIEKKKALLTAKRVIIAEQLKKVREVQEKLEEFIKALQQEK